MDHHCFRQEPLTDLSAMPEDSYLVDVNNPCRLTGRLPSVTAKRALYPRTSRPTWVGQNGVRTTPIPCRLAQSMHRKWNSRVSPMIREYVPR